MIQPHFHCSNRRKISTINNIHTFKITKRYVVYTVYTVYRACILYYIIYRVYRIISCANCSPHGTRFFTSLWRYYNKYCSLSIKRQCSLRAGYTPYCRYFTLPPIYSGIPNYAPSSVL
eukprot:sb/3476443/